jgi:lipoprotein-anchoring transpeptidase ErfK/SrfK
MSRRWPLRCAAAAVAAAAVAAWGGGGVAAAAAARPDAAADAPATGAPAAGAPAAAAPGTARPEPAAATAPSRPLSPAAAVATKGRPGERIALPAPARARGAYVAKVLEPVVMRARPGAGRRLWTARTQTPHSGGATRLLVLAAKRDGRGRAWLRIDAPIRPNAADGWIPARAVRLERTPWFLTVSTGRRELRVYAAGRLRLRARVVVGAPGTPTPHGLFAVYEVTHQGDPDAFVGPWADHLTALSEVLDDYGGGPGRVALHGRGPASLVDPLGSARSHGCIRADNAVLAWLHARVEPGTPVLVER